jgi:hypothetical protein
MGNKLDTYVSTASAKIVGGKSPDGKKKSLREQTNFGTGKKNKQSPGFFDMIVNYVKEKLD